MAAQRGAGDSRRLSPLFLVNCLLVGLAVGVLGVVALTRIVPLTGRMTFVVSGPSMVPTVTVGSAIVVEPTDPATLAVGDVISIKSGPDTSVFTHRITRIVQRDGATWFETKGDANVSVDPSLVPATHVIGKVALAFPLAGYLIAVGSQPSGLVFALSIGSLLLIAAWLFDPRRGRDPAPQVA